MCVCACAIVLFCEAPALFPFGSVRGPCVAIALPCLSTDWQVMWESSPDSLQQRLHSVNKPTQKSHLQIGAKRKRGGSVRKEEGPADGHFRAWLGSVIQMGWCVQSALSACGKNNNMKFLHFSMHFKFSVTFWQCFCSWRQTIIDSGPRSTNSDWF